MSRLHLFRDTKMALETSDPAPDKVISGHPKGQTLNVFESGASKIFSCIWRATIGAWRVSYDETEYCYITQGRARLLEDNGTATDVHAGDSFVIEGGFVGVWEVLEDMEKQYMIVLP
jgi:uncharacterized protein